MLIYSKSKTRKNVQYVTNIQVTVKTNCNHKYY